MVGDLFGGFNRVTLWSVLILTGIVVCLCMLVLVSNELLQGVGALLLFG